MWEMMRGIRKSWNTLIAQRFWSIFLSLGVGHPLLGWFNRITRKVNSNRHKIMLCRLHADFGNLTCVRCSSDHPYIPLRNKEQSLRQFAWRCCFTCIQHMWCICAMAHVSTIQVHLTGTRKQLFHFKPQGNLKRKRRKYRKKIAQKVQNQFISVLLTTQNILSLFYTMWFINLFFYSIGWQMNDYCLVTFD